MAEYRVTWTIEIEADSPQEAAEEAFGAMQDPDCLASFFEVTNQEDSSKTYEVGLLFQAQKIMVRDLMGYEETRYYPL